VNITVHRNGNQFGPYTLEQVNAYLVSGRLSPSDIEWYEDASQWIPLSSIQGVCVPPPPPPLEPKRSGVKLTFVAIGWMLVFWLGSVFVAGAIAGVSNLGDPGAAGRQAGESLTGLLFIRPGFFDMADCCRQAPRKQETLR
jgi:hypothetical protein